MFRAKLQHKTWQNSPFFIISPSIVSLHFTRCCTLHIMAKHKLTLRKTKNKNPKARIRQPLGFKTAMHTRVNFTDEIRNQMQDSVWVEQVQENKIPEIIQVVRVSPKSLVAQIMDKEELYNDGKMCRVRMIDQPLLSARGVPFQHRAFLYRDQTQRLCLKCVGMTFVQLDDVTKVFDGELV